jgi:hypothetical protein
MCIQYFKSIKIYLYNIKFFLLFSSIILEIQVIIEVICWHLWFDLVSIEKVQIKCPAFTFRKGTSILKMFPISILEHFRLWDGNKIFNADFSCFCFVVLVVFLRLSISCLLCQSIFCFYLLTYVFNLFLLTFCLLKNRTW